MKLQYKLGLMAVGVLAFTSCEKNDPVADNAEIGERVPTCYWEVGSTTCKAGDHFSFKGKYYTEDGHTPVRSEVWYNVKREDYFEATAQLGGLKYSKAVTITEEMRADQCIAQFDHSKAVWTVSDSVLDTSETGEYGYQWMIIDSVPVSETLIPVMWSKPVAWGAEEEKAFADYAPAGFAEEFEHHMDSVIVLDANYENLRRVFTNHPFTNEQISAVNAACNVALPLMDPTKYDESDPNSLVTYKSKLWFDYNNYSTIKKVNGKDEEVAAHTEIVRYYYAVANVDGTTDYVEVGINDIITNDKGDYLKSDESIPVFAVYDSAPWVFSRRDFNSGQVVSTVRPEYISAFGMLVSYVTFPEWICSSTDGYVVSFTRGYLLDATFKVVDESGNVGVAYNKFTISVN